MPEHADRRAVAKAPVARLARTGGQRRLGARVGELVKQFKEMSKMMKRMGGMGSKRISKSRRKAAKGKSKGPGGRTTGGGRTAPNTKAPLRLPNLDPTSFGMPGSRPDSGLPGLPDLGSGGGFPVR